MLSDAGFEVLRRVLDESWLTALRRSLVVRVGAGRRGLLSHSTVSEIACSPAILDIISGHLCAPAKPVRAMLFDKTQDTNWLVPWHQDLTIAVQERHDVAGFDPWSVKDGIPHVQPPVRVLERMLTLRLHLDDCDETNGALKVIPGSHAGGRLDSVAIREWRARGTESVCCAAAGDALIMRPLLLHASSRSESVRRRRVLHVDYASCDLPPPLQWAESF